MTQVFVGLLLQKMSSDPPPLSKKEWQPLAVYFNSVCNPPAVTVPYWAADPLEGSVFVDTQYQATMSRSVPVTPESPRRRVVQSPTPRCSGSPPVLTIDNNVHSEFNRGRCRCTPLEHNIVLYVVPNDSPGGPPLRNPLTTCMCKHTGMPTDPCLSTPVSHYRETRFRNDGVFVYSRSETTRRGKGC
jgi:hypothetical protein